MRFGDEIKMLRDYDGGRYAEGATYTVAVPGEPEDGRVMPNVAQRLCEPAQDGEGAYAKEVDDQPLTETED